MSRRNEGTQKGRMMRSGLNKVARLTVMLVLFVGLLSNALAQSSDANRANWWVLGTGVVLDFGQPDQNGYPGVIDQTTGYGSKSCGNNEGVASISDDQGDLLFYTNGRDLFNNEHVKIEPTLQQEPNFTHLGGHLSSSQSGVILPVPGSLVDYFVFSVPGFGAGPVRCRRLTTSTSPESFVPVGENNENVIFLNSNQEKLGAIHASNGNDVWVVTAEGDGSDMIFYSYRMSNGLSEVDASDNAVINKTSTISSFGNLSAYGQIRFSPKGDVFIMTGAQGSNVGLFSFDGVTGEIELLSSASVYGSYGAEFSEDGNFVYIASLSNTISQFDLRQGNTFGSAIQTFGVPTGEGSGRWGTLQLAPDGRIYLARECDHFLSVINNPSSSEASFIFDAVDILSLIHI